MRRLNAILESYRLKKEQKEAVNKSSEISTTFTSLKKFDSTAGNKIDHMITDEN